MRLLLSAFACAPGWGSEPGIGWGVAEQMARRHDVWLLTDVQSREPMEAAADEVPASLQVHYVDVPQGPATGNTYGYYVAWQRRALRAATRLHEAVHFELVHHVTYANSAMPSFMGRLGIPFLWYAGSYATTPLPYLRALGWRSAAHEIARNLAIEAAGRATRRVTLGARAMTIAVDPPPSAEAVQWRRLLLGGLHHAELDSLGNVAEASAPEHPFRVLSVGRLLGWKGFHLGLEAFARFRRRAPEAEYWIVGDGEQRAQLEASAQRLGLGGSVQFLGARPRSEIFDCMAASDVLLHPSWHEQVGFVVLEAMACGRPVVCLDVAGPPQLVGDTGKIVPFTSPEGVVDGLAESLDELYRRPDERSALGAAARRRAVDHWNWERVADELDEVYGEVVTRWGHERR